MRLHLCMKQGKVGCEFTNINSDYLINDAYTCLDPHTLLENTFIGKVISAVRITRATV